MEFKRRIRFNDIKYAVIHVVVLAFTCLLILLIKNEKTEENHILGFILLYSLIFFFPFLILLINYFIHSKYDELVFSDTCMIFKLGSDKFKLPLDNIDSIKKVVSIHSKENSEPAYFPWTKGLFYYYKITDISGKVYIITSLYKLNIDNKLKESINVFKHFFPFIL